MRTSRPPQGASPPAALPALLRATHLFGLALGSALGKLRDSGTTAARMFERAEESALLLRMTREAAEILGACRGAMGIAERCRGAMRIAGGAVARRDQRHALDFFLNPCA
jgi:hypothetical protein